ncbi:putative carboxypeptidase D [Helianthus anomalus]
MLIASLLLLALATVSQSGFEENGIGVVGMYWQDSPISVLDVYQVLIISGLRIWMFSGDTDVVIPTASTRYSIDALNLTTISPWRAWYEDAQVAPSILKIYIYIYIYIHTGGTRGGSRGSVDPPVSGTF